MITFANLSASGNCWLESKAVLRRTTDKNGEPGDPTFIRGPDGMLLDVDGRTATLWEKPVDLTRLEFDLLHHLLVNAGRVQPRERLLEQIWGYDYIGDTRAVDSAIKRLRAKLRICHKNQSNTPAPELIESVRGVGYRFKPG